MKRGQAKNEVGCGCTIIVAFSDSLTLRIGLALELLNR